VGMLALAALPAHAQDAAAKDPLPGVTVKLSVSADQFDPSVPTKATVKCLIENKSDHPIEVPIGYDGRTTQLSSLGLNWPALLRPVPSIENMPRGGGGAGIAARKSLERKELPLVRVDLEKTLVVFELPLEEILMTGSPNAKPPIPWSWTWAARSLSPGSPISFGYRGPRLPAIHLQAAVQIGGKTIQSDKIELKIKSDQPANDKKADK
jgi:hypothetical protein